MSFHVYKNIAGANWKCAMKKWPNVTENWCELLAYFTKEKINAVNIKCLISFCLALPGSNAPTERVFSIINALWSDKKTDIIETVNTLTTMKTRFKDFSFS
jgi:hypothetical protein